MERTLSIDCKKKKGERVLVKGWMDQLRRLGKINFLVLRDRGGYIQVVVEDQKELDKVKQLQIGTVLYIEAQVQEAKQTDLGVELVNPEISVVSSVEHVPPVEYNKDDINASLPTILDYRPLTIRNKKIQGVFKVQATILKAFRESLRSQDFIEFRNPVLIGSASESGADVFEVKYFDRKAYLCQSPQLYKQIMIGGFERAFCITPVFRAEKHHTNRHLTELTHMDGEIAFVEDYHNVLKVCEKVARDVISAVEKENSAELKLWNVSVPKLPKGQIPEITIKEALEIIEKKTGKTSKRKLDLEPEDEREICEWAQKEHGSDLLWVTHFYKDKNFYTWNDPNDPETSLSYDLLCRGIEWLSGTVRIEKYEKLVANMKKQGLSEKDYDGYLQAFKYGMPPEAGFSFGLERMTMKIFNFKNIREATLFPRDVERLAP
ncbi:aspartate--tRNA(Asn) ligase [Candidatus Dojkabacteria bacterium]|nr:aspartate--tRNA(Asn) ligase [Candidatus Dojkabacteria bacterium]